MRTFVTGGSGFVGRELIRALVARGHEVVALARSATAEATVRNVGASPARGDIGDVAALTRGMRGAELVMHAAASTAEWGTASDFEAPNVQGTANVLAAARDAGVRRLLHVSTEAVLLGGGPIKGATEDRPLPDRALGFYGDTKNRAEKLVRAATGLETVVVRPRFVWGDGDTSLLPKLVDAVQAGRWKWIGGGHYPTSTCHVQNLAHGALLAAERGPSGGVWFLTDGAPVDFRDFVSRMIASQGLAIPTATIPRWVAKSAAVMTEGWWKLWKKTSTPPVHRTPVWLMGEEVTVDDARARRELGYSNVIGVEAGLAALSSVK